jgi:hypothetical protein
VAYALPYVFSPKIFVNFSRLINEFSSYPANIKKKYCKGEGRGSRGVQGKRRCGRSLGRVGSGRKRWRG